MFINKFDLANTQNTRRELRSCTESSSSGYYSSIYSISLDLDQFQRNPTEFEARVPEQITGNIFKLLIHNKMLNGIGKKSKQTGCIRKIMLRYYTKIVNFHKLVAIL